MTGVGVNFQQRGLPQPHIERTFAAEAAGGGREADHQRREVRLGQPMRHGVAQHAALVLLVEALARSLLGALAGDHQHMAQAPRLRGLEEAPELRMGVALAHAMQVEPRLDLELAFVQLARRLPVERRGARHMSGLRRGLWRGLCRARDAAAASPWRQARQSWQALAPPHCGPASAARRSRPPSPTARRRHCRLARACPCITPPAPRSAGAR